MDTVCGEIWIEDIIALLKKEWADHYRIEPEVYFAAGYYEWNVFINEDVVYSFDELNPFEYYEQDTISYDDLLNYIDVCVDTMKEDFKARGQEVLSEKSINSLKKCMAEELSMHFDIRKCLDKTIKLPKRTSPKNTLLS